MERAYRDSRINRIFEGTNEINRLLTTGMLLKRAAKGELGLLAAAQKLQSDILGGGAAGDGDEDARLVASAKKIALLLLGVAYEKYVMALEQQPEVLAGITDVLMEAFAMESVWLRSRKTGRHADVSAVFLRDAMARIEPVARMVLAACSEGDALSTNMVVLRRFARYEPVNAIAVRRRLASRLVEAGRYAL
jgi:hypothetical protein